MKFSAVVSVVCSFVLCTDAAPTRDYYATRFTTNQYHPTFDAVSVGTTLAYHKGLHYTGFVVSTAINAIQPYPSPRVPKNKRYAVAASARAATADRLPTLRAEKSGGKFILNSFWWAASPYFSRNVTLTVLGYEEAPSGASTDSVVYSGKSAQFVYNTAYNVGANGAQLQEATMPRDFVFYAYKFNITDPADASGPAPTLYLDEFRQVSVAPSSIMLNQPMV